MLAQQRHEIILSLLKKDGNVHTADLVSRIGVSSETVRKDLDHLEKRGQLSRVHGGAVPVTEPESSAPLGYIALQTRSTQHIEQKATIAEHALTMIQEGQIIALDYGSTSQMLALALKKQFQNLTIVTNSIQNALILSECPGYTVILTGGILNKNEYTLVDNITPLMEHLHIDTYFMSVSGIDPVVGCTDLGFSEVNIQNWMRRAAAKTIVLADSSKFGRSSLVKVCPVSEVNCIITDSGLSPEMQAAFSQQSVNLVVV